MAQFELNFAQDLKQKISIRHCETMVFTKDNLADAIRVALYVGEEPYSGGGTVSATAVRSDGITVPITNGSITGNIVTVYLTEAAVDVPGNIGLYVKLTSGDTRTTVLAAIFGAQRTETDSTIDPGTIIPSVTDLINAIDEAVDSIPPDFASLLAGIAPVFSALTNYEAGAFVWEEGVLYRFTTAHPAGSWTGSDVVTASMGADFAAEIEDFENNIVLQQATQPTEPDNRIWFPDATPEGVEVPTWAEYELAESINHNRTVGSSAFVQGSRIAADPFGVRALATRCTTKYVYHLRAGDVLTIKSISTGYKAAIGSSSLYDSGWKTAEFAYTATAEMFAYVNVAASDGSTSIVPGDFSCTVEYTDNTSRTSATEDAVSSFTDKTNALVNRNNLFRNPQMLTHDEWRYLTTDFTVEPSENQEFGVFKVVTGDTQPYIYQVFQPSELPSGEYYFTFRGKVSDPSYIRLYIIAYPTAADSGGTTTQLAEVNMVTSESTYTKVVTMPNVSTYDHIRVLIYCGGKNKTYYLSELYLAPTGVQNYASYVLNAIRTAQASGAGSSSWLYGKTLYADGDSIAYGAGANGVSYADLLATKYNMTIDKQAVSGGTMGYVANKHCIANSVVSHYAGQDFVILDGGFNDLGNSVPVGAFPTSVEQPLTPSPDTTTFIGALQVAFQHIMNTNPTAKIWFLIPHRINKSYTKTTGTLGLTFADYVDAIRLVCNRYGVEILDVYDNVNFNTYLDVYKPYTLNSDTVHPTLEGYQKFYMPYIEKMTK